MFSKIARFVQVSLIFVLLGLMVSVATAQGVDEGELPEGDGVELVDFVPEDSATGELLNTILEAIAAVVYLPAAAGIVTVGTSAIKRFTDIPAKFIALTIMIVLWGIYSLATGIGYETQLVQVLEALTAIGFVLLGATGTQIVAAKVYEQSVRHNVPMVGYSRHIAEYQRLADEANG